MKVLFNPTKDQQGSGLTAFCSWQNPDLERAIKSMFGIRANESLETIEVTAEGITARLRTIVCQNPQLRFDNASSGGK